VYDKAQAARTVYADDEGAPMGPAELDPSEDSNLELPLQQ